MDFRYIVKKSLIIYAGFLCIVGFFVFKEYSSGYAVSWEVYKWLAVVAIPVVVAISLFRDRRGTPDFHAFPRYGWGTAGLVGVLAVLLFLALFIGSWYVFPEFYR